MKPPRQTLLTSGDLIRSVGMKPVGDASGVGGRGLGQVINYAGQIPLTITGDSKVQEMVRLTP